jgi:hypothetical protein
LISKPQAFVTILASGQEYIVHKQLITFYSPFFDRAFNGAFLEGQTQTMTLGEEIPVDIFGLFVHWLYTQQLCHTGLEPRSLELMELAQLWTSAGRFLVPKLQNEVMFEFFLLIRSVIIPDALKILEYIYETEEGTMLKLVAVYQVVLWNKKNGGRALCAPVIEKLPREMLIDLSKLLLKQDRGESIILGFNDVMVDEGEDANV